MTRSPPTPTVLRALLHPVAGPVLRVAVRGGSEPCEGLALLDTGASVSAIDRDLARRLQLHSPGFATWSAITETGAQHQSALRTAQIRLGGDLRWWEIDLVEVPRLVDALDGYAVCALLGWDFLRLCRLQCDGPSGAFSLELPPQRAQRRRA